MKIKSKIIDSNDKKWVNKIFHSLGKNLLQNKLNKAQKMNILLLGDKRVGKKSIIKKFIEYSKKIKESKLNKEGDYCSAFMLIDDEEGNIKDVIKLLIYSFGGSSNPSKEVNTFLSKYASTINAIVLVCDYGNSDTLDDIKDKYKNIKEKFRNPFCCNSWK